MTDYRPPPDLEIPRLLTLSQVAEALAISRSAAYRLAASGELITIRFGGTVRVLTEDLVAFVEERRTNGEKDDDPDDPG